MNASNELESGVERLLRGMYIYVPAILEDVDDKGLGVVVKKDDQDVSAAEVPIFSLYSGDGYGEKHALHPPEEGHMICPKYPTDSTMQQKGVLDGISKRRHHAFDDGHFIAGPRFYDFEAKLDSPIDAYHYKHKSGAERYIAPNGDMRFTHPDGHDVELTNSELRLSYARSDGDAMSITVSETEVTFDGPDLYNDNATNPRVSMGVSESGEAELDGIASIGDSDAHRRDTSTENSDVDDPRTYAEVDEPIEPIADPTDGTETSYSNPSTTGAEGPIDCGLYELRRHVPERREADPDPTVTDPTNAAYIELPDAMRSAGKLPVGYEYIQTTEGALKMIGMDATTPVVIKTL